jgi:hypothetical protein
LHGFPEFWLGWLHQIAPLADAGFRVLVPDQRGYGLRPRDDGKLPETPKIGCLCGVSLGWAWLMLRRLKFTRLRYELIAHYVELVRHGQVKATAMRVGNTSFLADRKSADSPFPLSARMGASLTRLRIAVEHVPLLRPK